MTITEVRLARWVPVPTTLGAGRDESEEDDTASVPSGAANEDIDEPGPEDLSIQFHSLWWHGMASVHSITVSRIDENLVKQRSWRLSRLQVQRQSNQAGRDLQRAWILLRI